MRRSPLLAMLVIVALLFASCGDDDTSTATEDAVEDPTEEVSEDTESETASETDSEEESEDDAPDMDEDGGDLGECGFLTGFATAFEDFDPNAIYGSGEATDFGEIFAPLAEAAEDVADAAPEEIRDAFRTMADGFATAAEELDGVVIDLTDPESVDPEAVAKLESLGESFGAEYESASADIDAWITENCADLADRFDLDAFGS